MRTLSGKRIVPAALLAGSVLWIPVAFLLSGRILAGHDLIHSYLPHAEVIRQELRSAGSLPLWDFHQFAGTPFLGNLVDGIFYPPNALLVLLPTPLAFGLLMAVHLILGAAGLYRLARSYRLSRAASAIAACAYALSFTLQSRVAAGHYGMVLTLCQAPLLLWLIRRLIEQPGPGRAVALALYATGAALGGHPPFVYQLVCLALAFAAFELAVRWKDRSRRLARTGSLAAALTMAALFGAVQFLPALEVRTFATRGSVTAQELYHHNPPDFSFMPRDFSSFLVPLYPRHEFVRGDSWEYFWHERAVYISPLPLLLACFALVSGRRNPTVIFFAGAGLLALADGMARTLPLHGFLMNLLPGYDAFRVPARSVWVTTLAGCMLAAFGWDAWRNPSWAAVRGRFLGAAGCGCALVATLLVIRFGFHLELGLGLLLLAAASGILVAGQVAGHRAAAAGFLLTAVDLGLNSWSVQPHVPPAALAEAPWYREALGTDPASYRVLNLSRRHDGYQPAMFGVRLMDGLGYPLLKETRRMYVSAWDGDVPRSFDLLGAGHSVRDPRPLDLLNVGWVLEEGPPREAGLIEIARRDGTILYRRPSARPYAFVGSEEAPAQRSVNGIRVRARTRTPVTLVVSESWMPGWTARIAGQDVPVSPFEGALLSVPLPPGEHEVEFRYRPGAFRAGVWISLSSLAAAAAVLVIRKIAARARPPGGAPISECTSRRA